MTKRILQLLDENRSKPREVRAQADSGRVSIYLSGPIAADYGLGLADLLAVWPQDATPVDLYINSPGGDVFEARAMTGLIARHTAPVTAIIDGVAASAASYLALSASTVRMSEGSLFMVHNAWALAMGDKYEMMATADLLDKVDSTIAADYARKTNASAEQITAWMNAETWFTAAEALAAKFVDAVDPNAQPQARTSWNLSAYDHAPKPEPTPEPSVDELIAAQMQRLRNRLRILDTRVSAPPHTTAA